MISEFLQDCWQAGAIAGGTFVSEDATCIATGLLIRTGQLDWPLALGACFLGIFVGDLGLWLIGRLCGPRVLGWRWVRKRMPAHRLEHLTHWFDRRGWTAVLAARFLPGTRLPVYLAAGMLGRSAGRFVLWAAIAALLWTPLLVLLVAWLGSAVVVPLERVLGSGWLTLAAALVLFWSVWHILPLCFSSIGRARLWARISRVWRWEFWPGWLFYAPLVPWIGYLAVRYRGIMTPTAANPGIVPHGGVVGESKFAILSQLPEAAIVPSALLAAAPADERLAQLLHTMSARGWRFPLILKPDAGQRGVGLKLVRDTDAARAYFAGHPQAVLAQTYHAGPLEAGIFYYRMPSAASGLIFSITDKHFPVLIGDGVSTVEALVWQNPRFRMQADTFLARLNGRADTVLAADERIPLAIAGNHCQGTLFRDGAQLITPALEAAIDAIAKQFDGFYFGRFDVRYASEDELKAGRGFAIVELNGVTSESTNLYDPSWSLLHAYRVLFRQWRILFEIGAQNRARGVSSSSLRRVVAESRVYYRERKVDLLSD